MRRWRLPSRERLCTPLPSRVGGLIEVQLVGVWGVNGEPISKVVGVTNMGTPNFSTKRSETSRLEMALNEHPLLMLGGTFKPCCNLEVTQASSLPVLLVA